MCSALDNPTYLPGYWFIGSSSCKLVSHWRLCLWHSICCLPVVHLRLGAQTFASLEEECESTFLTIKLSKVKVSAIQVNYFAHEHQKTKFLGIFKNLEALPPKMLAPIKHSSVKTVKRNQSFLIRSEIISLNTTSITLSHFCLPLCVCVCIYGFLWTAIDE